MNVLKDIVEIPIYTDNNLTWGTFFTDNFDEISKNFPMN